MYKYILLSIFLLPSLAYGVDFTITADIPTDPSLSHQTITFDLIGDAAVPVSIDIPALDPLGGYTLTYVHTYNPPATLGVGTYTVEATIYSIDQANNVSPGAMGSTTLIVEVPDTSPPLAPGNITVDCSPSPCTVILVP